MAFNSLCLGGSGWISLVSRRRDTYGNVVISLNAIRFFPSETNDKIINVSYVTLPYAF
jgi:hypothetical protein